MLQVLEQVKFGLDKENLKCCHFHLQTVRILSDLTSSVSCNNSNCVSAFKNLINKPNIKQEIKLITRFIVTY